MGIEEIKKAKEEEKKVFKRPSQKVAALLIALGPTTSSEILKNIKDEDLLEQITLDIANLGKVSDEDMNQILSEFQAVFKAKNYITQGGVAYAKQLLSESFGEQEAAQMLERVNAMVNTNPFYFLNEADPSQLANTFSTENPQLLALILAYLRPELAAQVLAFLPPDVQAVVSMRIADMTPTNPEILSTIEDIVQRKFSALLVQDFSNAGGVESLANILNCCDRGTEKNIMEWLDIENQKMAQEVRDLMFVFEDIVILDDRSIQRLLREVETKTLALALKGIKDEIKEKIFKNMSERAKQMLLDDMEYLGPVRAKEVQEAQTSIVNSIRTLEATGEITITRASVEDELIE
ncbi:MAG: flagellar motor switch protein FliG [bacterium]|nr:flagellar motor switch protein FliG [bacterium]